LPDVESAASGRSEAARAQAVAGVASDHLTPGPLEKAEPHRGAPCWAPGGSWWGWRRTSVAPEVPAHRREVRREPDAPSEERVDEPGIAVAFSGPRQRPDRDEQQLYRGEHRRVDPEPFALTGGPPRAQSGSALGGGLLLRGLHPLHG